MTDRYDLKITSAVAIDGTIRRKDSIVSVNERVAKDLLRRGKAELATESNAPQTEVAEAEAKLSDGLNVDQLKDALKAKGIEFAAKATKAELTALLDAAE